MEVVTALCTGWGNAFEGDTRAGFETDVGGFELDMDGFEINKVGIKAEAVDGFGCT